MKINNRRYIGSKTKLLAIIEEILEKYPVENNPEFFDAFGGTGVVTNLANELGYKTTINDLLYSNFVSYKAWFSEEKIRVKLMEEYIEKFNKIQVVNYNNYFSNIYGDKYYSKEVASKIFYIREEIESLKIKLKEREYYYLLTSLIYAADKAANTVGHFEHYLTEGHEKKKFKLEKLDLNKYKSNILCVDINKYVEKEKIKSNIVYLDPPYNARQYINFYHVLENLAKWEKPTEFEGKSMKFKRNHLKSEYSKKDAIKYFEHLINNIEANVIILSYNNTYNAKSGASNNKMQEEEILKILNKKGIVKVIDIKYNAFQAGKTDLNNHVEKFFITEVR